MADLILEYLYRIIVTIIILVPAITGILVAGTIIYSKDFKKKESSSIDSPSQPETTITYTEPIKKEDKK